MKVRIALGDVATDGNQLTGSERVSVIRDLTAPTMVAHLRGYEPIPDILLHRTLKHSQLRRVIPKNVETGMSQILLEESCVELYREFKWDPPGEVQKRHDKILYLSKDGLIIFWAGTCTTVEDGPWKAEVYESLSIQHMEDELLGEFLIDRTNFETIIESLRVLQLRSLQAAEIAIRELRDNLRRTSDTQHRVSFRAPQHIID